MSKSLKALLKEQQEMMTASPTTHPSSRMGDLPPIRASSRMGDLPPIRGSPKVTAPGTSKIGTAVSTTAPSKKDHLKTKKEVVTIGYKKPRIAKTSSSTSSPTPSSSASPTAPSVQVAPTKDRVNTTGPSPSATATTTPGQQGTSTSTRGEVKKPISTTTSSDSDSDSSPPVKSILKKPISTTTSPPESQKNSSVSPLSSKSASKDLKANVDQSLIPADLSDHCSKFLNDTQAHHDKRVARWERAKKDGGDRRGKFSYADMTQGNIGIKVAHNGQHSRPTHVYTHIGSCSGCDHIVTLSLPGRGTATFNDWFEHVGSASGSGVTWKQGGADIYGTEHTGDAWEGGGDRSWGSRSNVKALAGLLCEVEGLDEDDDLEARKKFLRTLPLCGNDLSNCLGE